MHLYIGSQGEIDDQGELTDKGRSAAYRVSADAEAVNGSLYAPPLVLFSADQGAGFVTARLIAEDLEVDEHLISPFAESVGRYPAHIQDIHAFIGMIMAKSEVEVDTAMVLFVSHSILVGAVAGPNASEDAVFELPEGWLNPLFIEEFAVDYDREDLKPW